VVSFFSGVAAIWAYRWLLESHTIRHVRGSDPLVNLEKEAPGIRANELFWKVVETTPLNATQQSTPLTCAEAVAAHLVAASRYDADLFQNTTLTIYLAAEGERMRSWCKMFRNDGWE